jgi:hypothetical protein
MLDVLMKAGLLQLLATPVFACPTRRPAISNSLYFRNCCRTSRVLRLQADESASGARKPMSTSARVAAARHRLPYARTQSSPAVSRCTRL